jgi:hypothetical protein
VPSPEPSLDAGEHGLVGRHGHDLGRGTLFAGRNVGADRVGRVRDVRGGEVAAIRLAPGIDEDRRLRRGVEPFWPEPDHPVADGQLKAVGLGAFAQELDRRSFLRQRAARLAGRGHRIHRKVGVRNQLPQDLEVSHRRILAPDAPHLLAR